MIFSNVPRIAAAALLIIAFAFPSMTIDGARAAQEAVTAVTAAKLRLDCRVEINPDTLALTISIHNRFRTPIPRGATIFYLQGKTHVRMNRHIVTAEIFSETDLTLPAVNRDWVPNACLAWVVLRRSGETD